MQLEANMTPAPSLRLGIEEEYQIIDPESRNLRYIVTRTARDERPVLRGYDGDTPLNAELTELMGKLAKPAISHVHELKAALIQQRQAVCALAEERGLLMAAAGTHPFASWKQPDMPLHGRYEGVMEEMRVVAKRLLIFGMHVHQNRFAFQAYSQENYATDFEIELTHKLVDNGMDLPSRSRDISD